MAVKIKSYQDLLVWQRSMGLVESIYRITSQLSENERFGLISQMRRAAVSAPSNIAEGFGRQARGEYRHHLSIARGSLLELETHIIICQRLGFFKTDVTNPLLSEITEISKMLETLTSKLR
jgi:four helix bundle protein